LRLSFVKDPLTLTSLGKNCSLTGHFRNILKFIVGCKQRKLGKPYIIRAFIRTGVNMQKIVIVANGAAYGSESLFNSLRLAIALREKESDLALRLFLMSDAVTAGLKGQKPAEGYNIQQMLEILTAQNVPVKLCKTCTDGRGITSLPLIDGVEIGTLVELAEWTLTADKVLTF
jgi:uncharacterized protein involved in oxidation of intracellular sulfur